ncbi:MAG: hypothetical protein Q8K00_13175 [Syntrophales bacterium]|nr:hypothetical protein [Syntrophales bacterium]
MRDTSDQINGILTSQTYSTSTIKSVYGIDLVTYPWVDSYLKDKEIRAKIINLEKEIPKIEALPIHKDELKTSFREALNQINGMMLNQIKSHLLKVQAGETALIGPENVHSLRLVYPMGNLTEEEMSALFAEFPEGVKHADIVARVKTNRAEINRLKGKIEDELSPQERWVHYETGFPMPYPDGCLWTKVVTDWGKIASRFDGNVNINGCALESDAETTAFFALGMDKVRKREPLKKPLVKPPRQKTGAELYNESVTIGPR